VDRRHKGDLEHVLAPPPSFSSTALLPPAFVFWRSSSSSSSSAADAALEQKRSAWRIDGVRPSPYSPIKAGCGTGTFHRPATRSFVWPVRKFPRACPTPNRRLIKLSNPPLRQEARAIEREREKSREPVPAGARSSRIAAPTPLYHPEPPETVSFNARWEPTRSRLGPPLPWIK